MTEKTIEVVDVYYIDTQKAHNQFSHLLPMLSFQINPSHAEGLDKEGLYIKAAEVKVPKGKNLGQSLSYAYEMTQNLENSWTDNPGVVCKTTRSRSSDVGDVMVVNGKAYMVASMGFKEVEQFRALEKTPAKSIKDNCLSADSSLEYK